MEQAQYNQLFSFQLHKSYYIQQKLCQLQIYFFSWYYFYLLGHVLDIRQSVQVAEAVKVTGVLS